HSLSEQRWFYCRLNRLVRDDAVFVIVSHENVTEIKVAQEKLSASLARYETLAAVSPVGILLFDESGGCIEANRRWSELSSLPEEKALGHGWLDFVHHSDKSRVHSELNATLKSNAVVESEFRLAGNAGQERWVYCQTECVLDATGQVTGYVKIF